MSFPDPSTRLCGVIGHPIAHSLSPAIHNAALRHDERNAVYVAFDVTDVETAVSGLRALGAVGVNVTVPHKRAAWELATRRSDEAERIGAANTLVFTEEGIGVHNTDAEGILRALDDLGASPSGVRCLVVGAGGAGRAAVWALASAGASEVLVANRTEAGANEVASAFGAHVVPWGELDQALGRAEIVVHATAVGMDGEPSVIADEALRRASAGCRALLDLVYAPGETDLVGRARAAGIQSADGLRVLVHQAAAAYRLFWGAEAPVDVMREAAAQAAGRDRTSPV